MNSALNTASRSGVQLTRNIFIDGIAVSRNENYLRPVIRKKAPAFPVNELFPVEILGSYWSNWNEPDIIKFKAVNGKTYIVEDDNLLKHICDFMDKNKFRGLHPYVHIEGEHRWECYPEPAKEHLLKFLRENNYNYDIYTCDGSLVREACNIKTNFKLNVSHQ